MSTPGAQQGSSSVPARRLHALGLLWIGLGAFLAIAALGALAQFSAQPWLIGSFGASCVLLFGYPEGPFSQPRNVIGGHVLTSLTALVFLHLLGPGLWSMALACGLATVLMVLTRTVHPPAGGNPLIVFMTQPDWWFLLLPIAAGAGVLMLLARLYWWVLHGLGRWQQRRVARPDSE